MHSLSESPRPPNRPLKGVAGYAYTYVRTYVRSTVRKVMRMRAYLTRYPARTSYCASRWIVEELIINSELNSCQNLIKLCLVFFYKQLGCQCLLHKYICALSPFPISCYICINFLCSAFIVKSEVVGRVKICIFAAKTFHNSVYCINFTKFLATYVVFFAV